MTEIAIAGRKLGPDHKPFIVAEVGLNHNGSLDRAMQMIQMARDSGCDAVKFATYKTDEFCQPSDPLYPAFKASELPDSAWRELRDSCDRNDIIFFSTPQNYSDLKLLLDVGVPCIKVGSDDLTNTALIKQYATHGLPIILSTGMADAYDVRQGVVAADGVPVALCVCTSEYPCPPEHANLGRITTLRQVYRDTVIGFSDHTEGPQAGVVASTLGASYFEKHFTLDNALPGPDHRFSANPVGLMRWVHGIRNARKLIGSGEIEPTDDEKVNRVHWRRASGQELRGVA